MQQEQKATPQAYPLHGEEVRAPDPTRDAVLADRALHQRNPFISGASSDTDADVVVRLRAALLDAVKPDINRFEVAFQELMLREAAQNLGLSDVPRLDHELGEDDTRQDRMRRHIRMNTKQLARAVYAKVTELMNAGGCSLLMLAVERQKYTACDFLTRNLLPVLDLTAEFPAGHRLAGQKLLQVALHSDEHTGEGDRRPNLMATWACTALGLRAQLAIQQGNQGSLVDLLQSWRDACDIHQTFFSDNWVVLCYQLESTSLFGTAVEKGDVVALEMLVGTAQLDPMRPVMHVRAEDRGAISDNAHERAKTLMPSCLFAFLYGNAGVRTWGLDEAKKAYGRRRADFLKHMHSLLLALIDIDDADGLTRVFGFLQAVDHESQIFAADVLHGDKAQEPLMARAINGARMKVLELLVRGCNVKPGFAPVEWTRMVRSSGPRADPVEMCYVENKGLNGLTLARKSPDPQVRAWAIRNAPRQLQKLWVTQFWSKTAENAVGFPHQHLDDDLLLTHLQWFWGTDGQKPYRGKVLVESILGEHPELAPAFRGSVGIAEETTPPSPPSTPRPWPGQRPEAPVPPSISTPDPAGLSLCPLASAPTSRPVQPPYPPKDPPTPPRPCLEQGPGSTKRPPTLLGPSPKTPAAQSQQPPSLGRQLITRAGPSYLLAVGSAVPFFLVAQTALVTALCTTGVLLFGAIGTLAAAVTIKRYIRTTPTHPAHSAKARRTPRFSSASSASLKPTPRAAPTGPAHAHALALALQPPSSLRKH